MKKVLLASAWAQLKPLCYNKDGLQHLCIRNCNEAISFCAFSSHISMLNYFFKPRPIPVGSSDKLFTYMSLKRSSGVCTEQ